MKILIPVIGFGNSGGNRTLSYFSTYWCEKGENVDFVCPNWNDPYFPTKANIIRIDKNGEPSNSPCEMSMLEKSIALIKFIKKNRKEYNVFLASHYFTSIICALSINKNVFYYIQAYEPEFYPLNNLRNTIHHLLAYISYSFKFIKIVNAKIYTKYKNLTANYIIPPGLDLSTFYKKEIKNELDPNQLVIGCIGRSEKWKGTYDVAEAIKILRNKDINIDFRIAFNDIACDCDYDLIKPNNDTELADLNRSVDIIIA